MLAGRAVGYHFRRGRRRTIGFMVSPEGLTVSAPRWALVGDVEAALQERANWVVSKLTEAKARADKLASNRIEWRDGAVLPFLGEPVRIVLDGKATGASLVSLPNEEGGAKLVLGLPPHVTADQIRDAVQSWLSRQAKRIFKERLDHFALALQVKYIKLSLSSAGTRWGSASADGSIRLNWRLVHFHMDTIDYVVVHELSHLRVMDHSPRFWEVVGSVMPDYAQRKTELNSEAIPRWE
jgi:predicted metal-dependent hydrolase